MKVRDFDDFLCNLNPDMRGDDRCDGLIWGDLEAEVRAAATTWMASMPVLTQAAALGVNLILTHEPTFWYHGTHRVPELLVCEQEGVDMSFKTTFLEEHGISIIRVHDCWDNYPEYGIEDSLRAVLGVPESVKYLGGLHHLYEVPQTTLGDLALHCKQKMHLPMVRVSGDLEKTVQRLVMAFGASSCTQWYYRFKQEGADAIISGEQCEWADIRPAIDMGLGVIELGHAATEIFGMESLARLLQEHFPNFPIQHIPTDPSYQFI